MNDQLFYKILIGLVIACALATLAHLAWAVYAYQHCSIIAFIAGELW